MNKLPDFEGVTNTDVELIRHGLSGESVDSMVSATVETMARDKEGDTVENDVLNYVKAITSYKKEELLNAIDASTATGLLEAYHYERNPGKKNTILTRAMVRAGNEPEEFQEAFNSNRKLFDGFDKRIFNIH
jgi:hypothetical protein